MKLKKLAPALLMLCPFAASAGENGAGLEAETELVNLTTMVRFDYQREYNDWDPVKANSGFEAKYLMFKLNGTIIPGLDYSWRQRLNKQHTDGNFFDATDWLYLDYRYKDFSFSAGKQVVAIGGWEYDRAPIDIYSSSVFWQNVSCFQLGASATYHFSDSNSLTAQMTESPHFNKEDRDLYAYNIFWNGRLGNFRALWSANMIEYADSRYISYISLGNRYDFNDKWMVELDLMNRASEHHRFLFRDCSVVADISFSPCKRWNIFAKYTYDVNRSNPADLLVLPGTELNMAGAGFEYFPLVKDKTRLRVHFNTFYSWGTNSNEADVMQNKSIMFDLGISWHMDIFSLKRK